MATRKTSKPQEATAMLRADHARVSALFGMYDKSRSVEKKHVKEERTEMFPKARKTKLDMRALGARMAERKAQLMASPG